MTDKPGTIRESWADDEYPFRLAWSQILELERVTDAGIIRLYRRMITEDWRAIEVRTVILQGLLGGGVANKQAVALVKHYVEEGGCSLLENALLCIRILQEALKPAPGAKPEKKTPVPRATKPSDTTSATSSEPPGPSASAPTNSTA